MTNPDFFLSSSPEQEGVPTQAILNFIHTLEADKIPMHSILILRNGKLLSETYYAPYDRNTLHRMFSITKTFTGIAIGWLAEEGKLSLDDPIIQYFPEKLPPSVHPYIKQMTIRHMLMMATVHEKTTYKQMNDIDWVKTFFTVPPSHMPGTIFSYDTSSSHTLAALVEKLTNQSLLDYLRTKFLNDIGFAETSYAVTDPLGITLGGSGLMARPIDVAKVAYLMMHDGCKEEHMYIPSWYVREAVQKQIDTSLRGSIPEEMQGYGYQLWKTRYQGFVFYGMGGQLALCLPEKDFLLVTTADTQALKGGIQRIYDVFWATLYPALTSTSIPNNTSMQQRLHEVEKNSAIPFLPGMTHSPIQEDLQNVIYEFPKNKMDIHSISIKFHQDEGTLCWKNTSGDYSLTFGLGKMCTGIFPQYNLKCATSGCFVETNKLLIYSHIIDEALGSVTFELVFGDHIVTLHIKKVEETLLSEYSGISVGTAKNNC